jgi:hypothetical protein
VNEGTVPLLIDEGTAAIKLGLSRYRLRMERREGRIAAKLIGNRYFYNLYVLESYANTVGGTSGHQDDHAARKAALLRGAP